MTVWKDSEIQFLRENYRKLSYARMAEILGKTPGQVKNASGRYNKRISRKWKPAEIALLQELYADTRTQDLADQLGKGLTAVYRMADKLGLKKSDAFNASDLSGRMTKENRIRRGLAYRFPKGHVPANKGLRRPGFAPGRMAETQFKKGSIPPNRRDVGEERTNDEGYVYVKLQDGQKNKNWRLKHWVVWEEANGREVPPRHIIHFRDNDKLNFAIENLELVSKADWVKRHHVNNYPEPVRSMIRQLGAFRRKLNKYAEK